MRVFRTLTLADCYLKHESIPHTHSVYIARSAQNMLEQADKGVAVHHQFHQSMQVEMLFPTAGFYRAAAAVVLLLLRQDRRTAVRLPEKRKGVEVSNCD